MNNPSQLTRFWNLIAGAHSSVIEIGDRRKAQLIATITLIYFVKNLIGYFVGIAANQLTIGATISALGLEFATIVAYILSRTKVFNYGAILFIFALAISAFATEASNTKADFAPLYSILPAVFIIGIALANGWVMSAITITSATFVVILPQFNPVIPSNLAVGSAGATLLFGLLSVILINSRNQIERERLNEVNRKNVELEKARVIAEQNQLDLEKRVEERTTNLQRRTLELETITDVAREISIVRNLDILLNMAVSLIRERFRYDHVGLFLVDERGEFAVLRSASGSGSGAEKMLEQNYKLKIGETGLVGNVTQTGQSYIALDTDKDSVYFNNPYLPSTRSELVLPLRARSSIIGALDIQSNHANAFDERDAQVFQLLADQLAAAIENAKLAQQVETTLRELNEAYRLQTQTIWQTLNENEKQSFEYDGVQIQAAPKDLPESMLKQLEDGKPVIVRDTMSNSGRKIASALFVPLLSGNQLIGVIGLEQEDPQHVWSDQEMAIAEAAANRAALTLENARLLEDSQRRATKERAIIEATARIGSALNVENILHIAAEELERVLGDAEVVIQLQHDSNG